MNRSVLFSMAVVVGLARSVAVAGDPTPWRNAPVHWTAHPANPVLSAGPPGAWDENIRERMWVVYDGGRFHGWYGGWKGKYDKRVPNLVHLGYATGAWDDRVVGPSSILRRNGEYDLFYIACGAEFRDGLAVSTDLVHWSRYPENPLIRDKSAVIVDTPDRYLLYCRQGPAGSATNLYVSPK